MVWDILIKDFADDDMLIQDQRNAEKWNRKPGILNFG